MTTSAKNSPRQRLEGLEKMAFQHPSDLAMLSRLERIPLLPSIMDKILGAVEKTAVDEMLGRSFHVTQKSLPDFYSLYMQACDSLCVDEPPPLYIQQSPQFNAMAFGGERPYIFFYSGLVSAFNDDELIYVMGHELGHIISGHGKYNLLVHILGNTGMSAMPMVAQFASVTWRPLLMLWSRRSEYTCDRAGLLACQSLETAHRANMKMAGLPAKYTDAVNSQSLLDQAEAFRERLSGGWLSYLSAMNAQIFATHPRPIERAAELQQWVDDGWFDEIVNGTPASRTRVAKMLTGNTQLAELLLMVSQAIIAVCVKELNVARDVAAPLIRKVIYEGGTLKDTPVQTLLAVELLVEKTGSDTVRYDLVLLINKQGNAVRQKYELPMSEDWDDVAKDIRDEFTKKREKQIIRQLYSV
jgi:Zn-dependent protease with chaperone function